MDILTHSINNCKSFIGAQNTAEDLRLTRDVPSLGLRIPDNQIRPAYYFYVERRALLITHNNAICHHPARQDIASGQTAKAANN